MPRPKGSVNFSLPGISTSPVLVPNQKPGSLRAVSSAELQLDELPFPVPPVYLGMTFARYRDWMRTAQPSGVAIGLRSGDRPVGLAIAEFQGETGEILSLFVLPDLQGRRLGTALLTASEQALRQRGAKQAVIRFNTELPSATPLAQILWREGWSPPETAMCFAKIRSTIAEEIWLQRSAELDGELTSWSQLSGKERQWMTESQPLFSAELWPFDSEESTIEPEISSLLRKDGEVIGYLVTHRVGVGMVRYTSLFVRNVGSRRERAERSFALLARSIRQQFALQGPEGTGTLAVRAENAPMLRILERRVLPHALSIHELRVARKALA